MGMFQCCNCGSADNTSFGWWHNRFDKSLTEEKDIGKPLCQACAPLTYPSGEPTCYTGKWGKRSKRVYLPHGTCFKNKDGNLEHRGTGLIGEALYVQFGRDEEYPK